MLHRHLTLERYELALEEDAPAAVRMRRRARACRVCAAVLAEPPLAPLLQTWAPHPTVDAPVDWQAALRGAIAPAAARRPGRRRGWPRTLRLAAVGTLLAGLLLATALPAAASTDPRSVLYPVRGVEEDVRWRLTPEQDRATLEADLVSAYLWQARTSAARHDSDGYHAAMQRFFTWAGRLQADITRAHPAQRSSARDAVRADGPLASALSSSGPDPAEARRAQSIIDDVQTESEGGDGQHGGGQQRGSGPPVRQTAPPAGSPGSQQEGGHAGPGDR
ncbi:MAG TPA: hypothetical protein VGO86_10615 [Candidatus Dormibacteraeota bacterium]|jgi:hypothetical protein